MAYLLISLRFRREAFFPLSRCFGCCLLQAVGNIRDFPCQIQKGCLQGQGLHSSGFLKLDEVFTLLFRWFPDATQQQFAILNLVFWTLPLLMRMRLLLSVQLRWVFKSCWFISCYCMGSFTPGTPIWNPAFWFSNPRSFCCLSRRARLYLSKHALLFPRSIVFVSWLVLRKERLQQQPRPLNRSHNRRSQWITKKRPQKLLLPLPRKRYEHVTFGRISA